MNDWLANPFLKFNERGQNRVIVHEPIFDNYYQILGEQYDILKTLQDPVELSRFDDEQILETLQHLEAEHLIIPRGHITPDLSNELFEAVVGLSGSLEMEFKRVLEPILAGPAGNEARLKEIGRLEFGGQLLYLAGLQLKLAEKRKPRFNFFNHYIPLINPEELFNRYLGFVKVFWNKHFLRILLLLNILAVPLFITNFGPLLRSLDSFISEKTLLHSLPLVALFIVQGVLHELGHGFACARFGRAPQEAGIVFMFLRPGMYIDTSAAYLLEDKKQRMAVSFAGILVNDLFVLLGLFLFLALPDGGLRDLVGVFVISNTLLALVAYSPFIKSDTYYILSDFLDVPNLRQESFRVLKGMISRKDVVSDRKYLLAGYAFLSASFLAVMSVISISQLVVAVSWLAGKLYFVVHGIFGSV